MGLDSTTALKINGQGIATNQPVYGTQDSQLAGTTPQDYAGFGKVQDMQDTNSTAFFFAQYVDKESTNLNGPYNNLRISATSNPSSGGIRLLSDIITKSGTDGYLSLEELQTWADEIGFTGDIQDVMNTMSEMDEYLYGKGILDIEMVDTDELEENQPEETTAETEPEEQNATEKLAQDASDGTFSVLDFGKFLWNGLKDIGKCIGNALFG